jgi:enoyl-CoA hydratase
VTDILVDAPLAGVKRITLNRPDSLNAFTFAMYDELIGILEELHHDTATRVAVITGSGRAFCAGHDLRSAGEAPWLAGQTLGKTYHGRHTIMRIARIPSLMRQAPQPIICAVNGAAAGIGYAIALCSDLLIAGHAAKFVNSIHNAGTGHELGLSYLLPRAIGTQRAAELLLTARPVLGEEAERIGLVLRTVADDQLLETAYELARSIMVNVPIGVWITKQSLWLNQSAPSLEAAMELEHRGVAVAQSTQDAAEKRASFLEKRPPTFGNR